MSTTDATKATSDFVTIFDDSKPSKLALHNYMDQYALSMEDTNTIANFISVAPQYRKRFHVPDDAIPQMMMLLHTCLKENIKNHFLEVQDVNEVQASGLMFEFEFNLEGTKLEFETVISGFIRILFRDILTKWIAFPEEGKEEHYCFYLSTVKPHYDCKTLKYKSNYRIVIPSIMLSADIRNFVYQRIWQSRDMKELFDKKLNHRIRDCFMRKQRTAPITLIGSSNDENVNEVLFLESVFKIDIENGVTDGDSNTINIDNKFVNVIFEASINYPKFDGGVINKALYLPNDECLIKIEEECNDQQLFQMAYDDAYAEYVKNLVVDRSLKVTYEMAKTMLKKDRFRNIESWIEIIKALASNKNRFYCVAVMLTKERTKNLVTWEEFQNYWTEAINNKDRAKYSVKTLRYWAATDSPSEMHRYVEEHIRTMLVSDVRDSLIQGRIQHSHIAAYLRFMFEINFVTHNVTKTSVEWYEFVTPQSIDIEPGQLYKWRCIGIHPDSLAEFISQDFKSIAVKVHSDLKSLCASSKTEEDDAKKDAKKKYAKSLFKAYDAAIISIFKNQFKKSVIEESTGLFKRNYFIKQMDKEPHLLGVGNGIVEFNGSEVKLINHYHTYPVSLFTDTNYVPYDENSPYVKTMYKLLRSLVPDNEMDALDFLLYFFSTSLDWHPKESLFFIVHGGGSNGKSAILELFRRTLGEMYARKMPLSFITDQSRNRSAGADPATMELKGARLVYYSESDRNERVNVAKVKEMTGGETLSARQLYKEQENFKVNCNHIVTTNHRFAIETTEHAVWRRFISYKFKICFKHECDPSNPFERPRDPKLIDLVMNDKRYQEAFLSILIHYRSKLYEIYDGQILKVPRPTIIQETEEYRQSEDIFQRYIMQRVYYYEGRQQMLDELITNFRAYYRVENGEAYKAKSADMIATFRNSILEKYIKESGGVCTLDNFYSCNEHTPPVPGSILFSEWINQHN